ncbi:ribosome small subunit-dependent GTPase A [Caenimonas aquaedulcis]|uniref:Small ribosomal subunit biogenesis GTPase RsgA n=1 Tax=Caenimonas aquaedulcis TaxID=2793270 RepID=A0A931H4D0_9BURK|nr:ribosome small subunit-dependent GTPase A [Caenimonas aquaedulcis]MBG9388282.1 ribosome small subunit-dependent GTPase A [Caenimonas aquaedulcis]
MIDFQFETLSRIGLTPLIANQFAAIEDSGESAARPMRIVETQRDWFTLHDGLEERLARTLPRVLHALQAQGDTLTIGDWVLVETDAHQDHWITRRAPPVTQIARRANDGRRQPLASNVDTALLVMGLDADFNARRIERYIALVRACGVACVVVLTKADAVGDAHGKVALLRERMPDDLPILAVNGTSADARLALAPWLGAGQTLVLLGSSGAGKSTLTNTLTMEAAQDTGAVRRGDGRGRHTTTARSMHLCPEGACIIDTPGLRTWRPDADAQALASTFDDVQRLAPACRFRDCTHRGEPGCAVRDHVSGDRLLNMRKLMRDAQRSEQTPLERIAQRRKWKALGKAGNQRAKEKRR